MCTLRTHPIEYLFVDMIAHTCTHAHTHSLSLSVSPSLNPHRIGCALLTSPIPGYKDS